MKKRPIFRKIKKCPSFENLYVALFKEAEVRWSWVQIPSAILFNFFPETSEKDRIEARLSSYLKDFQSGTLTIKLF